VLAIALAELYEQQLPIVRKIGDRRSEGSALGNLGNAYKSLGETRRAVLATPQSSESVSLRTCEELWRTVVMRSHASRRCRRNGKRSMDTLKAHHIWIEQCEAAHAIKSRFGVTDAFDYLVGEKLLNFAEAAADRPDFARELPRFVSEVRRLFTADEIAVHLARLERVQNEQGVDVGEDGDVLEDGDVVEEEDIFAESPAAAAARVHRFTLLKELLTASALGTS
jgi:hypothetical protein